MVRSTVVNAFIIIGLSVLVIALPAIVLSLVFKSTKSEEDNEVPVSIYQPVIANPSCNIDASHCVDNVFDLRNCLCPNGENHNPNIDPSECTITCELPLIKHVD